MNPSYLKIILSLLLILCLADMPYGYYELVRFVGMIGFGYLAYQAYQESNQQELIIFVVLALLFQPFEKIALGRAFWNAVDIAVAVYLLYGVIKSRKA